MDNVEFEEENKGSLIRNNGMNKKSKLVKLLVKKGIVKNESSSKTFLLVISIVFILVAILLFFSDELLNKPITLEELKESNDEVFIVDPKTGEFVNIEEFEADNNSGQ